MAGILIIFCFYHISFITFNCFRLRTQRVFSFTNNFLKINFIRYLYASINICLNSHYTFLIFYLPKHLIILESHYSHPYLSHINLYIYQSIASYLCLCSAKALKAGFKVGLPLTFTVRMKYS